MIPTNKPVIREDLDDAIFAKEPAKFHAIADRISEAHATGQPVLVGTISIENSERISDMLKKRGVKHNVLNAKQHEKEAEIVAEAGRLGAVTIATNMAGRGTDIILGGNPEFEAKREMKNQGYTEEQISFATSFVTSDDEELLNARKVFGELLEKFKAERAEEQQKVRELGGLCIIGTERHESRRIDNQLRGRSGRQGDPGQTQFFISLEDDLMRLFGGERIQGVMNKFGMQEEALAAGMLSKTIESAQKKVESRNFEIRKYVLQYDNVMNKQREVIYDQRRKVLFGDDIKSYITEMMEDLIHSIVVPITVGSKFAEEWDFDLMNKNLKRLTDRFTGMKYDEAGIQQLTPDKLEEDVVAEFNRLYDEKEAEIGAPQMREVEKMILLRVVDNRWMDHIDAMDDLKQGIGLRSLGHIDPAIAYSNEGFDMFEEMIGDIKEETVRYCFGVTVNTRTQRKQVISGGQNRKEDFEDSEMNVRRGPSVGSGSGQMPQAAPKPEDARKPETFRREQPKIGRNDPCPCGSGKKYKNCCMNKDLEQ